MLKEKEEYADAAEAIKFDAGQDVIDLFDTVKEVVPNIERKYYA